MTLLLTSVTGLTRRGPLREVSEATLRPGSMYNFIRPFFNSIFVSQG